jgi:ribosomal protein S12 methylthiotransferase
MIEKRVQGTRNDAPSLWLTTLGCAKNHVDSEKVMAMLSEAGYTWAASPEEADVVMVNTCAFIEAAKKESLEALTGLAAAKAKGQRLIAAGSMTVRPRRRTSL